MLLLPIEETEERDTENDIIIDCRKIQGRECKYVSINRSMNGLKLEFLLPKATLLLPSLLLQIIILPSCYKHFSKARKSDSVIGMRDKQQAKSFDTLCKQSDVWDLGITLLYIKSYK